MPGNRRAVMRRSARRLRAVALLASAVLDGCRSNPWTDSCFEHKGYPAYDWSPLHDDRMIAPETLPPEVRAAVNHKIAELETFGGRHATPDEVAGTWPEYRTDPFFRILAARDEGKHILLDVEDPRAFGARFHLVYSRTLECVVGSFGWYAQE